MARPHVATDAMFDANPDEFGSGLGRPDQSEDFLAT